MTTTSIQRRTGIRPRAVVSAGFAGLAYLAFVAVSGYAVAFLAGRAVPRTVDRGGPHAGTATAVLIDLLLLAGFATQHSVMARPAFKRRCRRLVPQHMERACYVLATSAVLAVTFWQWRSIPAVAWNLHDAAARAVLWALFVLGWFVVFAMTFVIDHLDMLGLRQIARHLRGHRQITSTFKLPLPYQLVRHPMMTGFFIAFLAAPRMTAGHLLFALLGCGYIVVAVRLEEQDLTDALPEYRQYAAGTPRFIPRPGRRAFARGRHGSLSARPKPGDPARIPGAGRKALGS
jgi:protein-S-isoprenylcysteine O-methyltransferase Ste14